MVEEEGIIEYKKADYSFSSLQLLKHFGHLLYLNYLSLIPLFMILCTLFDCGCGWYRRAVCVGWAAGTRST